MTLGIAGGRQGPGVAVWPSKGPDLGAFEFCSDWKIPETTSKVTRESGHFDRFAVLLLGN